MDKWEPEPSTCPECGHQFYPLMWVRETDPVGIVYCPRCNSRLEMSVTIGGYTGRPAAALLKRLYEERIGGHNDHE